jgi:hypothetical protein
MYSVDVKFSSSSRPRNKTKQEGSSYSGYHNRPALKYLHEYEAVTLYDTTVKSALNILIDALLATLGPLEHPDPEIQAYLRYNVEWMLDVHGIDFNHLLKKAIKTAMWGGYSVSEVLYGLEEDTLFIKDIVNYHPSSITIRTNKKGRLSEDEPSVDGQPSGIYQSGSNNPQVQLPIWKSCYLVNDSEFNNYYGRSLIEAVYRWHVLKEAITDMMTVALDRFGNPIIAITVPRTNSQETEVDPETGEERVLSTQEVLERQMQGNSLGQGNVIVLPQVDPDLKPEVKVITTGNNVGSTFLEAIEFCDMQMIKGLLVPYGLVNTSHREGATLERQIEIYNRIINGLYKSFIRPAINQSFGRLIKFSFSRTSAKKAPSMPVNLSTRPQDTVALMQVIKGLTSDGYFNPTNKADWSMVRQMVSAVEREQKSEDVEFVKQLIVYPRQKDPGSNGVVNPERDRSNEGNVNGVGGRGRPTGVSTPQLMPRE